MRRHSVALRLVAGSSLAIAAGVTIPALASSPPIVLSRLVSPHTSGPVDLGDRVAFRSVGPSCTEDAGVAVVHAAGHRIVGRPVNGRPDPRASRPDVCAGIVRIPSESRVRAAGWGPGDPISVEVRLGASRIPLVYSRVEVDRGRAVEGKPTVVAAHDPRTARSDKALQMSTGDVIDIGRVDLTKIYSVSFRICLTLPKPHVPTELTLRAGAPDGPVVLGPVDVADDLLNDWKSIDGWPDCWQLQPWPITGEVPGRAPRLFLEATLAAEPILVNSIDFNGTGAKVVERPARDPRGTRQLFDGRSYKGWDHDGCALTDHAVRTANHVSGCSMTYAKGKVHNVMLRLEYRQQDFAANGGIFLGNEIQMREPGEWLTGGYLGDQFTPALVGWAVDPPVTGYPAQRIKTNTYPDWSQIEIVQLGAHYRVTINNHVVTDYVAPSGDPGAYDLQLVTQPEFAFHYGVSGRFDAPYPPTVVTPESWGNIWYKNVRLYQCTSTHDPVCTGKSGR